MSVCWLARKLQGPLKCGEQGYKRAMHALWRGGKTSARDWHPRRLNNTTLDITQSTVRHLGGTRKAVTKPATPSHREKGASERGEDSRSRQPKVFVRVYPIEH